MQAQRFSQFQSCKSKLRMLADLCLRQATAWFIFLPHSHMVDGSNDAHGCFLGTHFPSLKIAQLLPSILPKTVIFESQSQHVDLWMKWTFI